MTSRLTLYTRTVAVVGAAMLLHALLGLSEIPEPLEWLLFSALVLFADRFTLGIASVDASISVSDTFFIAAALLFGPGPAMLTLAVDGGLLSLRRHHAWDRVCFNMFAPALSLGIGTYAFFFISRVPPLADAGVPLRALLLPLVALTLLYFGLNSGLTAVAVALESGQPAPRIWRRHMSGLAWSYFAAASTALCLVLIVKQVGILAFPIILPNLAEFHLTLRTSFGRVQDAERHLSEMDHLYLATVETLAMAMDAKDAVTHSHVRRVQTLALALAGALRVTDQPTLRALKTAALLHDTGKLAVPERILNKPGKLTAAEFDEMKRHVDVGADILSLVPFPFPVVPIVRCHHENWDGTGYPRGVAGIDIPIGARILSVADCYDALTSDRPYRARLTDEEALAIVRERRGTMYDPVVVDACLALDPQVRQAESDEGGHTDVMQQLLPPDPAVDAPPAEDRWPVEPGPVLASDSDLTALIHRVEETPEGTPLTDVLVLSSDIVQRIAPEAIGAWFLPDAGGSLLEATAPFGRGAALLTGRSIGMGERLTGWVGVHRQLILNSDAALDLGAAVSACAPALAQCVSVPLADGTSLAGVLTLYAAERHPFSDEQGRRLEQVAPYVAKAISRAGATVKQ